MYVLLQSVSNLIDKDTQLYQACYMQCIIFGDQLIISGN